MKNKKESFSKKDWIQFIIGFVLFVVPFVFPMPVRIRWFLWLVCWASFVCLMLMMLNWTNKLRILLATVASSVVFVVCSWSHVQNEWRTERAAMTTGYIHAIEGNRLKSFPIPLEFGQSGTRMNMMKIGKRAGLEITTERAGDHQSIWFDDPVTHETVLSVSICEDTFPISASARVPNSTTNQKDSVH